MEKKNHEKLKVKCEKKRQQARWVMEGSMKLVSQLNSPTFSLR